MNSFLLFLGLVMDKNLNHFPTLLIVCILSSILFYIAAKVVHIFHQRNNSSQIRASVTNGAALSPEGFHEEQEMTDYLKNQENK